MKDLLKGTLPGNDALISGRDLAVCGSKPEVAYISAINPVNK